MRICHIAESPFGKLDGKLFSPIASVRLRALEIAPELVRLGHGVTIMPTDLVIDRIRDGSFLESDIYVLQKTLHDVTPLLELLKSESKTVVVDVCDDINANAHMKDFYPALIRNADLVTASSETLAKRLAASTAVDTCYVPDCVELSKGTPRAPASANPELLWFGRGSNIAPLLAQLDGLKDFAAEHPLRLTLVSDLDDTWKDRLARAAAPLAVTFVDWSPASLESALAKSDIVLLPLMHSEAEMAKSSNRLQEAIWAGRCVVASDSPSHAPFAEWVFLADELAAGVRAALSRPDESLKRIELGQAAVDARFTPERLASVWVDAFEMAQRNASRQAPQRLPGKTRLNLGCGDKPMPGYVNVDIASSRKGREPDILSDLRRLEKFGNDSVDEVIAIHVIEHFHRWEVGELLSEWCRVLRPGGKLTLECPNLLTACEELLRDPTLAERSDVDGGLVMWPLYGDPSWKDPLMAHRWGYTPDSLKAIMQEVGLVDVRREHAQFKRKDPRDMRVTGFKTSSR